MGLGAELVVEQELDALAGGDEVEDAAFDAVAVVLEDERLGAELDALGEPGALGEVGGAAALVVDGGGGGAVELDEVHAGDEAELGGGEEDGSGVDALVGRLIGVGERAGLALTFLSHRRRHTAPMHRMRLSSSPANGDCPRYLR